LYPEFLSSESKLLLIASRKTLEKTVQKQAVKKMCKLKKVNTMVKKDACKKIG